MALGEKLAKISQELQTSKTEAEKRFKDKELEPVRAKIKELEVQKYQLELVKGSLELRSGEKTGKGMREYSSETKEQSRRESQKLDILIEKNKEALQSIGIKDRDQLVENPEFAEEEEVVSYKKSAIQNEGLKMSDSVLQERLQGLGVNFDTENFSYDFAEKALSEKLKTLERDLVLEKLKTPEGRENVLEMATRGLENSLPKIDVARGYVFVNGSGFSLERLSEARLLPENIKEYQAIYGEDITEEAIKKIHEQKVRERIFDSDRRGENIFSLQHQMELVKPEEAEKAKRLMENFIEAQNKFRIAAKQKSEELKEKNINFDPAYATRYGGEYEDYIRITEYRESEREIMSALEDSSNFPPEFDFVKLQDYISNRMGSVLKFTEAVKGIKTREDVNNFLGSGGAVSSAHTDQLKSPLSVARFKFTRENSKAFSNDSFFATIEEMSARCKTYAQAEEYLNGKSNALLSMVPATLKKIELATDVWKRMIDFLQEAEKEKFSSSPDGKKTIESMINGIEVGKKSASKLMSELTKLESELPRETVVLEGGNITVPAISKRLEELKKDTEGEEKNLTSLKATIGKHKSNEPRFFGKDKWEDELADLERKRKDLEKIISKMKDEDFPSLARKQTYYVPVERYCPQEIEELVKSQKSKGGPNEVFGKLRAQLGEIIDRKVSESVAKLYREYQELEKQMQ